VCWTSAVEAVALDDVLAPHEDYPGEAAAYRNETGWVMVEGSIAPNDTLPSAWSTWGRMRQGPSGHYELTMGGRKSARRGCMVELKTVESDVGGNEGEGPG
jgi:hypothetical protein